MPLDRTSLQNALTSLFTSPPNSFASCAQQWADAMRDYSLGIIPPSTTVAAASATLSTTLSTIFSTNTNVIGGGSATASSMELAFTSFAALVGTGMQPTYTATPPSAPVGFSSLFSNPESTVESAVQKFTNAIDIWMRTGQATLNSPPGTVVIWS